MDPHSILSQYNQRTPKSGPAPQNIRFMDVPPQKPSLDGFSKRTPGSKKASSPSPSLLIRRPIATNSRIKQDEKYRKDMYLAFVNNALQQKCNGVSEPFDELVDQFNPKRLPAGDPPTAQLRLWISALSHIVSRLERTHSTLVEAIVNMPWTMLDTVTVKSYIVFIGMLVSARPEYLSLVLGRIAQGLTHQSSIQALNTGAPESSSSPLTRRTIYDRLHYLLRYLLSLIPTLPSTLQPLLIRNFPHKRQHQVAQTTYIRNLLRVTSYCPELNDKIMATIIDRAIQIDVEIQVELEELEELEKTDGTQEHDVFEFDAFDSVVGQEEPEAGSENEDDGDDDLSDVSTDPGDVDDIPEVLNIPRNAQHIHDMVKKLDAILTLLFEHFDSNFATPIATASTGSLPPLPPLSSIPGDPLPTLPSDPPPSNPSPIPVELTDSLPSDETRPASPSRRKALHRSQFHTLLSIFDRTIIRTFKSRYTQFLIFWYSSLDSEFSDLFQGLLVSKALLEYDLPAVTRAAAASYIGSFISRALFIDAEGARRVVGVLCEFMKTHLDAFDLLEQSEAELPSTAHHTVFYAVVQAVFLIFCFRWRDFLEEQGDEDELLSGPKPAKRWLPALSVMQRVVTSSLNPLKICSTNVVMQFARVAHVTDFVYCYSIVESNRRSEYNTSSGGTPRHSVHRVDNEKAVNTELSTFFPFDPYRLPRSVPYIAGVYREWASVAIDVDDEDSEDGEEEIPYVLAEDTEDELAPPPSRSSLSLSDARLGDGMGGLGEGLSAMSISPAPPPLRATAS